MSELGKIMACMEILKKLDDEMPIQQITTLLLVAQRPGLSVTELADATGQSIASASRNVAALGRINRRHEEGHKLIDAKPSPQSRRKLELHLTARGRTIVDRMTETIGA